MKPPREQLKDLLRGAVNIITEEELLKKLEKGAPLRVKLGVDPSSPDIHLGHTVVLRKLRQFQDAGHTAVLIIGDFTALVGDPTGKKKTRPQLTPNEVEANAKTYIDQVTRVLTQERLEVVRNSTWLKPLPFYELVKIAAKMTVAHFMERDDFSKRYKEGTPIHLHEFLYLVMQAYDSVEVKADVELGGTDQLFNLMVGRDLMRDSGMDPQVALTTPILTGLDGHDKMSKSLGNHIGVSMDAFEMYSKVMSMPDAIMKEWYTLLTHLPMDEIEKLCDSTKTHPKSAKDRLAREVVKGYHPGKEDGAALEWQKKFSEGEVPKEMPELTAPAEIGIVDLIMLTKLYPSKSEAKRLIEQGGVELDGQKAKDLKLVVKAKGGEILRVGKQKKYFRLVLQK
ncbi:MAG TPA: tyrosine--tRNA ligase [Planctomycetota bacterium]|jgi:tyrosyl-tRNA synthetase|nr:tyrosine--tRNA ligase [Planctomycetota bacterium]